MFIIQSEHFHLLVVSMETQHFLDRVKVHGHDTTFALPGDGANLCAGENFLEDVTECILRHTVRLEQNLSC